MSDDDSQVNVEQKPKEDLNETEKEQENDIQNRKKFCYFKKTGYIDIDYKDTKLLRRFVNDQGKIMPRRVTGTSSKMHRNL